MAFTHLHVHTEHSLLDGMIRIRDLFARVAEQGGVACAVTDHGSLSGIWKAQQAAQAAGVRLIPGVEAYLAVGLAADAAASIEVERDDTATDEGDAAAVEPAAVTLAERILAQWGMVAARERRPLAACIRDLPNARLREQSEVMSAVNAVIARLPEQPVPQTATERRAQASWLADALSAALPGAVVAGLSAAIRPMKPRHHEHVTLLALSRTGWQNLLWLQNQAELPEHRAHGKPRIDLDMLTGHTEGLMLLTGCVGGPVMGPLSRGEDDRAEAMLRALIARFGRDQVAVELMEHGIAAESRVLPRAVELADRLGVVVVATNDAHYLDAEDASAHAAWLAKQSGSTLANPTYAFHGHGYHLADESQMRAKRPESWWQRACDETARIAARAEEEILPSPKLRLPKFPLPAGVASASDLLREKMAAGAQARFGVPVPEAVTARLDSEFAVVEQMGMADYFLIVEDMISWAKSRGILVGAGRGSAAGSMLSYVLGIVEVDPLEHGLLFERFLEPGRQGMPDIDTDVEAARRGEVFAYLADTYGADHVARIGTFGVARSKEAVRSAVRVLGEPVALASKLAGEIPMHGAVPRRIRDLAADRSRADAAGFWRAVAAGGAVAEAVVELAGAFEDVVTKVGIHACGVLVSSEPIGELVPLRHEVAADGARATYTAWDGEDVEQLGLCKLDVLGLTNLDIVRATLERATGEEIVQYSLADPPGPDTPDDARVAAAWALLQSGRTQGVFQLESSGMQRLVQDVRPQTWEELSAILALYRPGPMSANMHVEYGARKRGERAVTYTALTDDPGEQRLLAGVLDATYGLLIFQEQVMELGRVCAGFGAADRSSLRKAVGKKKPAVMAAMRERFLDGAVREVVCDDGRVSPALAVVSAQRVWELIAANADYLFNKSHSQAYARLTFLTAYFKANVPAAYGAAMLAVLSDSRKQVAVMDSLEGEGVVVLPPEVNRSGVSAWPEQGAVRLGLHEIAGVGFAAAGALCGARQRLPGGRFSSFAALCAVVPLGVVRQLVQAGACDGFGSRLALFQRMRAVVPGDVDGVLGSRWPVVEAAARQRQVVSRGFGDSPLVAYWPVIVASQTRNRAVSGPVRSQLVADLARVSDAAAVRVPVLVESWEQRSYSRGKLASIRVETRDGRHHAVTMWQQELAAQEERGVPEVGGIAVLRGRMRVRERTQEVEDAASGAVVVETVSQREVVAQSLDRVVVPQSAACGVAVFGAVSGVAGFGGARPGGSRAHVLVGNTSPRKDETLW